MTKKQTPNKLQAPSSKSKISTNIKIQMTKNGETDNGIQNELSAVSCQHSAK
jgi:hypothetical protein